MKYINQNKYPHIPYRTRAKVEGLTDEQRTTNVAESGCGLCCACMAVDYLTDKTLTVEECVRISEECVANHSPGTDLNFLGPAVAEKFGLDYSKTNDPAEAIRHLQNGGVAIVLVGIPTGKEKGLFTAFGHYMLILSTDGEEFCFLDPSYTEKKFKIPERAGKVNEENAPYLYCDVNTMDKECENILFDGRYHLLSRKKI